MRSALYDEEEKGIINSQEDISLNIQPKASILSVFSRLSYRPWYAIAEFVDNSTQSYISHADILDNSDDFEKLIVKVKYNADDNHCELQIMHMEWN